MNNTTSLSLPQQIGNMILHNVNTHNKIEVYNITLPIKYERSGNITCYEIYIHCKFGAMNPNIIYEIGLYYDRKDFKYKEIWDRWDKIVIGFDPFCLIYLSPTIEKYHHSYYLFELTAKYDGEHTKLINIKQSDIKGVLSDCQIKLLSKELNKEYLDNLNESEDGKKKYKKWLYYIDVLDFRAIERF